MLAPFSWQYLRVGIAARSLASSARRYRPVDAARARGSRAKHPIVIVLGGARVSEKLGLIRQLLKKADRLLIGGGMAFTFLRALGHETGQSPVESKLIPAAKEILAEASARHVEVLLPEDLVVSIYPGDQISVKVNLTGGIGLAMMGLDIGTRTVGLFREALRDAGTIVWNGPMGMCRMPAFAVGTTEMAKTIAECPAFTVAGGGDTVAAIAEAGVAEKFGHLSMAGAAFLEYLEGRELPGVAALAEARPVTSGAEPR
jgi:3-phosphoglycerate kinase